MTYLSGSYTNVQLSLLRHSWKHAFVVPIHKKGDKCKAIITINDALILQSDLECLICMESTMEIEF